MSPLVGRADLICLLTADPSGKLLNNAAMFAGYEKVVPDSPSPVEGDGKGKEPGNHTIKTEDGR